jgi:hypothetical protein
VITYRRTEKSGVLGRKAVVNHPPAAFSIA